MYLPCSLIFPTLSVFFLLPLSCLHHYELFFVQRYIIVRDGGGVQALKPHPRQVRGCTHD